MNRFVLNFVIALKSLENFRLRTTFAVLGIFFGTLSVVVVTGVTASLVEKTAQETRKLGDRLLVVRSGTVVTHGAGARLMSEATTLTVDDARSILQGSVFVEAVSPSGSKVFPVRRGGMVLPGILVSGVDVNFPSIRNFYPREGLFWNDVEEKGLARVAVLGKRVADRLFGSGNPVGKYVLVWRVPFQVMGVMEEKGADLSGADMDNEIFVPLSTFLHLLANRDYVDTISVKAVSDDAIGPAKAQIEEILRVRHGMGPDEKDDFTVVDPKDVFALKTQAVGMIKTLGTVSSLISFSIGGIGILSIMILIVNERRLEIGIRRAVGGRRRDIAIQFLTESSLIAFTGGTIGMLAGLGLSLLIFRLADLPSASSPAGHVLALFATVSVGILAGLYPARKATAIEPIEVIRA